VRVALVTAIVFGAIGLGLFLFVVISKAIKKTRENRREREELLTEVHALEDLLILIKNEIALQEQAGYADNVLGLRHILDSHPELTNAKELS
jgi:hypothetical protein